MAIKESKLVGNVKPHSITLGPDGYLWVTTHDKSLIQVNPEDPDTTQLQVTNDIRQLSAGIIPDPSNRVDKKKVVWFASPAHEQDYDPIVEYQVDIGKQRKINEYKLGDQARAQTITWVMFEVPGSNPKKYEYYIMFAEPVDTKVGYVKPDELKPRFYTFPDPKQNPVYDTWLWSVAVTVPKDNQKLENCTYWATGQVSTTGNYVRKTNGLYKYTPGVDKEPQHIALPAGANQKPVHVICGTDSDGSPCIWVSTTNPNQICKRKVTGDPAWIQSDTLPGEPRQLMFATDGNIWVAASTAIYRFKTDNNISQVPSAPLPQGSEAMGICLDSKRNAVWYTNPSGKSIGKYDIPKDPGKTQYVAQLVHTATPGQTTGQPLLVQYINNGIPIPGIPLTCRLVAEGTTFTDGSQECLLTTDSLGRAVVPPLRTGTAAEEVRVEVGYADTEPPTTMTLHVKHDGDEDTEKS